MVVPTSSAPFAVIFAHSFLLSLPEMARVRVGFCNGGRPVLMVEGGSPSLACALLESPKAKFDAKEGAEGKLTLSKDRGFHAFRTIDWNSFDAGDAVQFSIVWREIGASKRVPVLYYRTCIGQPVFIPMGTVKVTGSGFLDPFPFDEKLTLTTVSPIKWPSPNPVLPPLFTAAAIAPAVVAAPASPAGPLFSTA